MTATALLVPYITAWSGERLPYRLAFETHPEAAGPRLTYTDPTWYDRLYGVLWARQGLSRTGRPEWKLVNTLRQRRAMLHSLCQVCGQPATDPGTARTWWLLADDPSDTDQGDGYTNAPPTCRACIPQAVVSCPRLRRSAAAYTVTGHEPYGVLADVFTPRPDGGCERVDHNVEIPLEAFTRLETALAAQMLVVLHGLRREPLP